MKGQHEGMPGAIELRLQPWRSVLLILLCAGFVAVGWWMAGDPARDRPELKWWGWGFVTVFGLGLPLGVREMFRRGPRLVLSSAGIDDRASGLGLIPWSEIADIQVAELDKDRYLMLTMRDPDTWEAQRPAASRVLSRLDRAIGLKGIPITISGLDMRADDIIAEVGRRFAEHRRASRGFRA